jgi:hypothetical protein
MLYGVPAEPHSAAVKDGANKLADGINSKL